MLFYGAHEIMVITGVSRSKAYEISRSLAIELKEKGFLSPKEGMIQASVFCEKFKLKLADCEKELKSKEGKLKLEKIKQNDKEAREKAKLRQKKAV